MFLLSEKDVIYIHVQVLNAGELQGMARDKSLAGALSRIDFRFSYGLVKDEYDLAATYAVVISTGHLFNDGNKRTAFRCLDVILRLHGAEMTWHTETIGRKIIQTAQGRINEIELSTWLRSLKRNGEAGAAPIVNA